MRKRSFFHEHLFDHLNPVIRWLIIGDVLYYAGVGLLGPILALFIVDFIEGGSIEVAGIAVAIYLVTKSVFQIPAAVIIDKVCGDKDDFWFMFFSLLIASLAPLAYLFVSTPLELYVVQFILGVALAFNFPSFLALFTKYISPSKEATSWSMYYTLVDLFSA
ncbi:MFS transporter, partial [Patescibacteria group bacterium]|nr:MFS transporter [Patescibacteria group bacterium]